MAHTNHIGPRLALYTLEQGNAIIEWIRAYPLPVGPLQVTEWMCIEKVGLFVSTQFETLATYKPLSLAWVCAVERLEHLKKHLEK